MAAIVSNNVCHWYAGVTLDISHSECGGAETLAIRFSPSHRICNARDFATKFAQHLAEFALVQLFVELNNINAIEGTLIQKGRMDAAGIPTRISLDDMLDGLVANAVERDVANVTKTAPIKLFLYIFVEPGCVGIILSTLIVWVAVFSLRAYILRQTTDFVLNCIRNCVSLAIAKNVATLGFITYDRVACCSGRGTINDCVYFVRIFRLRCWAL